MNDAPKVGDRVRVTRRRHVGGYHGREQGTVLAGPTVSEAGWSYYFVQMEDDDAGHWTVFAADEIEVDAGRPDTTPALADGTRLIPAAPETDAQGDDLDDLLAAQLVPSGGGDASF